MISRPRIRSETFWNPKKTHACIITRIGRTQVPKLAKKIAQVRERLDNSLIANLDASEEEVLRFLGKEEEKLGQLKDRATELMDYQVWFKTKAFLFAHKKRRNKAG